MILVDTSVWVDFFRGAPAARRLRALLEDGEVLVHPWVIGELALGHLGRSRRAVIDDLSVLPAAPILSDLEVRAMIDARGLAGSGIGWVDAQLIASSLVDGAGLWTLDRKLAGAWRSRYDQRNGTKGNEP
jgi:predicted nucleic acid-binding protein